MSSLSTWSERVKRSILISCIVFMVLLLLAGTANAQESYLHNSWIFFYGVISIPSGFALEFSKRYVVHPDWKVRLLPFVTLTGLLMIVGVFF